MEIAEIQNFEGGGFLTQEEKGRLSTLESSKSKILKEQEDVWRLKSRAIWLECGDDNTKSFQSFMKGRKMQNTIWELKSSNNDVCSSFEDLALLRKTHFESLFKVGTQETIAEVIEISQFFPGQITKYDNT